MAAELPRLGMSLTIKERKAAGLCIGCSVAADGKVRCDECTKRNNHRNGPGACKTCRANLPNPEALGRRCASCLEKTRVDYRARVARGQCVVCRHAATAGGFCFDHWLKNIGNTYGMTFKNGQLTMLKQLWLGQNAKCALTGMQLIPGFNASLDHILPVSKGGNSERSNLRWILLELNKFRSTTSDAELIELCYAVIRHHEKQQLAKAVAHVSSEGSN